MTLRAAPSRSGRPGDRPAFGGDRAGGLSGRRAPAHDERAEHAPLPGDQGPSPALRARLGEYPCHRRLRPGLCRVGEREERQAVQLAAAHRPGARRHPRHQVLPGHGLRPPLRPDHRDLPELASGRKPRPGRLRAARREYLRGGHRTAGPEPSGDDLVVSAGAWRTSPTPVPGRRATGTPGSAPSTTGGACCTWATSTASGETSPAASCPGWPHSAPAASSTSARSARSTPPSPPTPAWPPETPVSWTTARSAGGVFAGLADNQPDIRHGVHVTSPSILLEDTRLAGRPGRPSVRRSRDRSHGTRGGLGRHRVRVPPCHLQQPRAAYPADLSNERRSEVIQRRISSSTASTRSSGSSCKPSPATLPQEAHPHDGPARRKAHHRGRHRRRRKVNAGRALHGALKDAGHHAILVGKHTTEVPVDAELSAYLDSLNAIVYRRDARVGAACGDHYWLFALAAWYTLQDRLVIQPALAGRNPRHPRQRPPQDPRPVRRQPRHPAGSPRRSSPTSRPPTSSCSSRISPAGGTRAQGRVHPAGDRANRHHRRGVRQLPGRRHRQPARAGRARGLGTIDVTGLSAGSVLDQALAMLTARLGIASTTPATTTKEQQQRELRTGAGDTCGTASHGHGTPALLLADTSAGTLVAVEVMGLRTRR